MLSFMLLSISVIILGTVFFSFSIPCSCFNNKTRFDVFSIFY